MKFDARLGGYSIHTGTKDKPGSYMIAIELTDDYGKTKLYSFKVTLQPRRHSSRSSSSTGEKRLKNMTNAVFADATPVAARLREVSLRGVAKVKFPDKIKVPLNYT